MDNITPVQTDILHCLRRGDGFRIEWDDHRGVASLLRGADFGMVTDGDLLKTLGAKLAFFGPDSPPNWLRPGRERIDDLGWRHVEYQQVVRTESGDFDLYRSRLVLHVGPGGEICSVQSSCYRDVDMAPFERLDEPELRRRLDTALARAGNATELAVANMAEPRFPIMTEPLLVIYPWKGELLPTYVFYAYVERGDVSQAELCKLFVDARTGEHLYFAPASRGIRTPDLGSGLSVTPLKGGFHRRQLHITAGSSDGPFYLEDITLPRKIITYSAAGDEKYNTLSGRRDAIFDDTLPMSRSHNKLWDGLASGRSLKARIASQQPEVDLHHYMRVAFEWYHRLAGRIGWDNNELPVQPIRGVAHVSDSGAHMRRKLKDDQWIYWLEFSDGDATDYMYSSGSHFIVAHEYQHAVTDHIFRSRGRPDGLDYADASWSGALDEGSADGFAGFISGDWRPCRDISPVQMVLRNLAFPRDTEASSPCALDHFADRALNDGNHARGTILAHAAYLMAVGGVHQRVGRSPTHIAVAGLGTELRDGFEIPKAAFVFYRALAYNFGHHGALTGEDILDETLFEKFGAACVDSAAELYGEGSREHRRTARAFYAVGLLTPSHSSDRYGPDVAMLPPAAHWAGSYPYVGLNSLAWSSRDLFVHNGEAPDPNLNGLPEPYENTVFCRVRNYGDEPANDIEVTFEYALLSTGEGTWYPVVDARGNKQVLSVGTLNAGEANFPDSAQDAPPATASVKWCLPSAGAESRVCHYCLRARVISNGALWDEVRSAGAFLPYDRAGHTVTLLAVNPTTEAMKTRIELDPVLPRRWSARLLGDPDLLLAPGEQREIDVEIRPPARPRRALDVPLDGQVVGRFSGPTAGEFRGVLAETAARRSRLTRHLTVTGRLSAIVSGPANVRGQISGQFQGTVSRGTGRVSGTLLGAHDAADGKRGKRTRFRVRARLRPFRGIRITQVADGGAIGGIVLEVHDPAVPRDRPV